MKKTFATMFITAVLVTAVLLTLGMKKKDELENVPMAPAVQPVMNAYEFVVERKGDWQPDDEPRFENGKLIMVD